MDITEEEARRIREKFTTEALERLLSEIYGKWQHLRRHSCPFSSAEDLNGNHEKPSARVTTRTQSVTYPASECRSPNAEQEVNGNLAAEKNLAKFLSGTPRVSRLKRRNPEELRAIVLILKLHVDKVSEDLLKQLKRKDNLLQKRNLLNHAITVVLQRICRAKGLLLGDEEKIKFSKFPGPGDSGFSQWHEAMKMVCRLPGGIPAEFRKTLWLTLSEQHFLREEIEWAKVERICFNERSNPDDEELGAQIVKDLHRTGCSSFCGGAEAEFNQALLKRVLLAYARWNKKVGYCQGFNMLAALLLEVMDHDQAHALKAMIYLVEGVLPLDYFGHSLRGLSVDMAAFRDLLRLRLPELSKHLDQLQHEAKDGSSGYSYEPPLVNVFTMQWFLTLFSTCLPQPTVLRVWDLVFLEGSEILLRTALALWEVLESRISHVESADEFYSIMAVLTREMLEFGLMDTNQLIEKVVNIAPFPFPGLSELRDKYTYNIAPWMEIQGTKKSLNFRKALKQDGDEEDDEESRIAIAAVFSSVFPMLRHKEHTTDHVGSSRGQHQDQGFIFGSSGKNEARFSRRMGAGLESTVRACGDRANLDISALKNQYSKLRQRQRQAHVILTGAAAKAPGLPLSSHSSVAMNHLLLGKRALSRQAHRMARTAAAPLKSAKPEFGFRRRFSETPSTTTAGKEGPSKTHGNFGDPMALERTIQPAMPSHLHARADGNAGSGSSSSSTELCDDLGEDTEDDFEEIPESTIAVHTLSSDPLEKAQGSHQRPDSTPADKGCSSLLTSFTPHQPDSAPASLTFHDTFCMGFEDHEDPLLERRIPRDGESVGSLASSDATSVASGLGDRFSLNVIRRQRSFDAQKVIDENLEILEKLRINRGSHTRNNSTADDPPPNEYPYVVKDVFDETFELSEPFSPNGTEKPLITVIPSDETDAFSAPMAATDGIPAEDPAEQESDAPKDPSSIRVTDFVAHNPEPLDSFSRPDDGFPTDLHSSEVILSPEGDSSEEISTLSRSSSRRIKVKPVTPFANTAPVFIEPTKPITFNPFPSRTRKSPNEVAVKLGLYRTSSPDS